MTHKKRKKSKIDFLENRKNHVFVPNRSTESSVGSGSIPVGSGSIPHPEGDHPGKKHVFAFCLISSQTNGIDPEPTGLDPEPTGLGLEPTDRFLHIP